VRPSKNLSLVVFLTSLVFLTSCSKKSGDSEDTSPPIITIVSPLNNQVFTAGQTIQITVNASDNDKVTELHIQVINKTNGNLLRLIHSILGQANGTAQDSFIAEAGVTYIIEVLAQDPAQNLTTSQVEVSGN